LANNAQSTATMIVNSIAMNIENIPLYSTILLIHKAPSEITNKNIFLG